MAENNKSTSKQRTTMLLLKNHNFEMHSYILKPNIPFLSEMNAESTAVLHDMISETKPEIQGGW